jgi:hypothetical protein
MDMDPHIAETLVQVLRERLIELETLEATGAATEGTIGSLALCARCWSGLTRAGVLTALLV